MENSSIWKEIRSCYAFAFARKPEWDDLKLKLHIQHARNALLLFSLVCIVGYLFTGKSFLNISVVVFGCLLIYIFVNEKTIGALYFITVSVCLGVTWFRLYIVGPEAVLYNHVHMMIIPLPIFVFSGSYRLTFFTFIYLFFFAKYSGAYIRDLFEASPDAGQEILNYFIDNGSPLFYLVWVFLSLVVYQKQLLFVQLWKKQKEKEELLLKLQKKNEELEELHKSKTKLLLGLSHEFRNPINAALGNLDLAQEKISDPAIQKFLVNCKVSIEMLFHLVSNLLDSTKLEAGILELNPLSKRSKPIFYKVWDIVKNLLDKQKLTGEFYIHKNIPSMLKIDSHFTKQILLNLILNAIKYTNEGSIMIVVSWLDEKDLTEIMLQPTPTFYTKFSQSLNRSQLHLDRMRGVSQNDNEPAVPRNDADPDVIPSEPSILINTSLNMRHLVHQHSLGFIDAFQNTIKNYKKLSNRDEKNDILLARRKSLIPENPLPKKGFLKIEVYDSGIGIDFHEMKDNIFKKFSSINFQSGDRLSLGLGLWLTKSLCEAMGGKVKAFSEKNKGSQFVTIIPAESCSPLESQETSEQINNKSQRLPIKLNALVVDDDKYNREINSLFLTKAGVLVKAEAANGKEAVEIFRSKPANYFDLVLLDLEMPVMNGKEAARRIRQYENEQKLAPVKIVIATGNCDLAEYSECMDVHKGIKADFFYRKPLFKKDVEEFVEILYQEKTRQKICLMIKEQQSQERDTLHGLLKQIKVNLIVVNSVEEAKIIVDEWKDNLRWMLVDIKLNNNELWEFIANIRNTERRIDVIGVGQTLHHEESILIKEQKINKFLQVPFAKEAILRTFQA